MSEVIHRCELCGSAVTIVSDPDGEGTSHYQRVEAGVDEAADEAAFVAWNRKRRQDGAGPWRGVDLASVAWHAALAYARRGTNVDA